jgi:hypothetical protein
MKAIGVVAANSVDETPKTAAERGSTQSLNTASKAPLMPKPSSATLIAM